MVGTKKMPSIGSDEYETSYPDRVDYGACRDSEGASLAVQDNGNAANFVEDPDVFNESPAEQKSYAWNRGEEGNANGNGRNGNGNGHRNGNGRNGNGNGRRY